MLSPHLHTCQYFNFLIISIISQKQFCFSSKLHDYIRNQQDTEFYHSLLISRKQLSIIFDNQFNTQTEGQACII